MSAPFKIAYNIDCEFPGTNRQAAIDAQVELHSPYVLLYDDYKNGFQFTKEIQARSPETQVIHRRYMPKDANGGWDGNLWEAPDGNSPTGFLSATNWINFLQNLN